MRSLPQHACVASWKDAVREGRAGRVMADRVAAILDLLRPHSDFATPNGADMTALQELRYWEEKKELPMHEFTTVVVEALMRSTSTAPAVPVPAAIPPASAQTVEPMTTPAEHGSPKPPAASKARAPSPVPILRTNRDGCVWFVRMCVRVRVFVYVRVRVRESVCAFVCVCVCVRVRVCV